MTAVIRFIAPDLTVINDVAGRAHSSACAATVHRCDSDRAVLNRPGVDTRYKCDVVDAIHASWSITTDEQVDRCVVLDLTALV
jgi:hypothetical protein